MDTHLHFGRPGRAVGFSVTPDASFGLSELTTATGRSIELGRSAFLTVNNRPVTMGARNEDGFCWNSRSEVSGTVRFEFPPDESCILVRVVVVSGVDTEVAIEAPRVAFSASADTRYFDPNTGGSLRARSEPFTSVYPGGASVCATFAAEPGGGGVGVAFLNAEQRRIELRNGPEPERGLLTAVFRRLTLTAGESLELPPFYLTTAGTWQEVLAPYRDWVATEWPMRVDTPAWVTGRRWLFLTLLTNDQLDIEESSIDESIEQHVEHCIRLGVEPIVWIQNWWRTCDRIRGNYGFDHVQGDFDRARPEALRAVAKAKELGAKIVVYLNITAIGEYSDLFHEAGDMLIRGAHGGFVRNWSYPMMMLCPGAPQTIGFWRMVMTYLFSDLGIDGVFLDQAGAGHEAPYCYHPAHGHRDPDCYGVGMLDLLADIRATVRGINPEALVFGELAHDARSQHVDFWLWHWFFSGLSPMPPGYAEALIWMRFVRPDSVFVEQEPVHCSPEAQARRVLGHGVWINPNMPGQQIEPYHMACWSAYRRYRHLFEGPVRELRCDDPAVSALVFGPVERDCPATDEVIVAVMGPHCDDARTRRREVRLTGLPFVPGEVLRISALPEQESVGDPTAVGSDGAVLVPARAEADVLLIERDG